MKLINNSKPSMVKLYLNVTRRRRGGQEIFSFDFQNSMKLSEILLINLKNVFPVCVWLEVKYNC